MQSSAIALDRVRGGDPSVSVPSLFLNGEGIFQVSKTTLGCFSVQTTTILAMVLWFNSLLCCIKRWATPTPLGLLSRARKGSSPCERTVRGLRCGTAPLRIDVVMSFSMLAWTIELRCFMLLPTRIEMVFQIANVASDQWIGSLLTLLAHNTPMR